MLDLEAAMRKLADAADSSPHGRVWVWRQILTGIYGAGFEDGYRSSRRDAEIADELREAEVSGDE